MKYLLDTTVVIDHALGDYAGMQVVRRLFAETGDLYTCDVVTCETLSRGSDDERASVRTLLSALEYVAMPPEAAAWAGDRRRDLIESGRRKPSVGDALVAGVAWRLGAIVVTRNVRDFEHLGVPVLGYGELADGAALS